jgi:Carboxypeptidase regulatory-like domain/TonB dependent receptor-like, beta-barrel
MKVQWRLLCLIAALMSISAPAFAQIDQGRLTGTVTDAQGAVLPGVTVTAKSPALMGMRSVTTEADGTYSIAALPSGEYELTFELSGFAMFKRGNIKLAIGQILTVDSQMQVASLQESVTVSAASPVVDMQNTKVGTDFTADKLVGVPTATDIWAVLGQASGVRMNGFDVGGSHKSQQTGYESFGIRNQNRVLNDGVDTTEGTGGAGFYADYFANEEVAVAAAGGDVEMNAPGSAVVNTIKSGGNTVKMLNNLTYQQESFVGDNQTGDAEKTARGYTGQPNIKFWEGHTDIGGPVMKDKFWYFGAYNHFKIDKQISGVPRNIATDLGLFDNYTTKETFKASQKDTVIGYIQYGRKQKPNRGLSVTVSPEAAQPQDSISWVYKGEHQRVWSSRLFTSVKFNLFGYDFPLGVKTDYQTHPARIDTSTNFVSGVAWDAFDLARQKPQVTAQGTYFVPDKAGNHDIKVGFEYVLDISKYTIDGRSGPIRYRDLNRATNEIQFVDVGNNSDLGSSWTGGNNRNQRYAGYAQDRWSPNNRTTLTLGVRWDYQRPYYLEGKRDPLIKDVLPASVVNPSLIGKPMFEAKTFPESAIITRNSIAPRLGVSYDLTGQGKTVLKGFYGRFYYNYADAFSALNPSGANYKQFKFNDVNGNRLYDGPQELGAFVSATGGVSTIIDPNVKKPYADEYDASVEHQFWGESSVRVAYVRKNTVNEIATMDLSRVGHFTVPVTRTIPIQEYQKINGVATTVTTGTATLNLVDLDNPPTGANTVTNMPDGKYMYDTLQFAFNKRFGQGLFIQTSYDYQWRNELRGGGGLGGLVDFTNTLRAPSTSPLDSDPMRIGFFNNANPSVPNRQKSTNWQGRAMARYVFPFEIGAAGNLRVQSGFAYSRIYSVSLPVAGTVRVFSEDIDTNRSDTVPILDLRADKAFGVGRYKFTVMADLFNALNSNAVTNFGLLNGSAYNQIIAALDPRTFQVGVRFAF